MPLIDPVCGMEVGSSPAEAEALGAFVVERDGQRHYLCSSTCKAQFERRGDAATHHAPKG